ncbi:hypothetical protein [Aequorivita echinoideorum]|uniref:Uncharacterized protein n=1 Tax=Aequorivita echinoideorum TaxID=1549647 RepID=A0ABS5S354_9FLAO|nr:hypothetical protein [Aequorivita echinoideorum]MBT0607641.1 hypothetical protein [Aequorivita echinoideorum]
MQQTVYLNDVLEEMRTPNKEGRAIKFNMSVRSLNKNSKTGGKMYHYENAKLVMEETPLDPLGIKALQMLPSEKRETFKKSPNHFKNKTRNIRLEDGSIKKIHIKHIIRFNGKTVIY